MDSAHQNRWGGLPLKIHPMTPVTPPAQSQHAEALAAEPSLCVLPEAGVQGSCLCHIPCANQLALAQRHQAVRSAFDIQDPPTVWLSVHCSHELKWGRRQHSQNCEKNQDNRVCATSKTTTTVRHATLHGLQNLCTTTRGPCQQALTSFSQWRL
jgi:hypothetical protein